MKAETYTTTGVPVVRGNNLTGRPGFFGELVFVSESTAAGFTRCLVRPGDLVFPHRGAIGEVGLVIDQGFEQWMLSTSMMKFRPDPSRLDPRFAFYFFRSPIGRHQLLKNASQVGTPGIAQPLASLRACEIALPPLRYQHATATVLGALDEKIEHNRRTARTVQQLARSMFRAWFVEYEPIKAKLAGATAFPAMPQHVFESLPTGFVESSIGAIPEGWQAKTLSSVCTVVSGGTPKRSEASYWNGDVPWYSVKDAPDSGEFWVIQTSEQITPEGVANSAARIVPKGSTIISARGTVGKLAMAGVPMAFNQSCYALLPEDGESFGYVHLLLHEAVGDLKQRTHGSVFDTITRATFDDVPVPSPRSDVVASFEAAVNPLLQLLLATADESLKLTRMRDYLLPALLSGKARLENADA